MRTCVDCGTLVEVEVPATSERAQLEDDDCAADEEFLDAIDPYTCDDCAADEEADFWEAWDDFYAQHGRDPEPEELAQMLAENEEDCDDERAELAQGLACLEAAPELVYDEHENGPRWCDRCSPDPCDCDDGPDDLSDLGPLDEDEENPDV